MSILLQIRNLILHPIHSIRKRQLTRRLRDCIEANSTECVLEALMQLMSIMFVLDKPFRKNIEGFKGTYRIQDHDGGVDISIRFADNKMTWQKKAIANPNIDVDFADSKAICSFLFSQNPDILDFVLHNKVSYTGNLNYLFKFAYMAKHLQLKLLS